MSKYILVDAMNLFHRSKWVAGGDLDTRVGLCIYIMFTSIKKAYRDLNGDHVVFCMDSKSWRKQVSSHYKANRAADALKKTSREIEEDAVFMEAFNELSDFFLHKTNATVLKAEGAEADDLIALWIDLHEDDEHIILSSDSDFVQLLAPNVQIYNGINEHTYTHNAIYDKNGDPISFTVETSGKIKLGKKDSDFKPDPDWIERALFVKCIRGDKSDNIFPAFPGARYKGTKNKVGILEAFNDRHNSGYDWNNFMLQTWTDTEGEQRTVYEEYQKNQHLIDLTKQPKEFAEKFIAAILEEVRKPPVQQIGINFMKFCSKWDQQTIIKYPDDYAGVLNNRYTGRWIKDVENV